MTAPPRYPKTTGMYLRHVRVSSNIFAILWAQSVIFLWFESRLTFLSKCSRYILWIFNMHFCLFLISLPDSFGHWKFTRLLEWEIFKKYLFILETESTRVVWVGGGVEGEGKNLRQTPHRAWSSTWGSVSGPETMSWTESRNWTFNQLSHPDAPWMAKF